MPQRLLCLRSCAGILLGLVLWLAAGAANATVWAFPGNLPSTCSGSSGSYTCSALSLSWGDSITISTATTITVTGAVSLSGNNVNYPTSKGALSLVFTSSSPVTVGGTVNINGSITTSSALTLSNGTNVTGNVTAGGALTTQANTITGNVTANGAANIGWNTTITGTLNAVTLSDGGDCTYGTSSTPASTVSITLTGTGASSMGGSSKVYGGIVSGGNLTGSSITVNGNISVAGTATFGWGATLNGTLSAVTLSDQGGNVYGSSSMTSATTAVTLTGASTSMLGSWSQVYGSMTTVGSLNVANDAISGNLQVGGTLTPNSSDFELNGTLKAASINDNGNNYYDGAVTITGNATFGWGTELGSTLTVGGTLGMGGTWVDGNVTVTGSYTSTNWENVVVGNVVAASFTDNGCGGYYEGNLTVGGGTLALCSTVTGNVVNDATSGGVIDINSNAFVGGCVLTNTTAASSIDVNAWNPTIGAVCCYSGGSCLATSNKCYAVSWWFGNNNTGMCKGLGGGSVGGGTPSAPASFNAVASGAASTSSHLYTQLVNNAFTLDIYALNSGGTTTTTYTGPVKVELVNAGSGSCATTGATCQGYASILTITASSAMTAGTITGLSVPAISNAYKDVCVRVTSTASSSLYGCSVGNFTIRPQTLTVTAYKSDGVTVLASSSGGASGTPTVPASSAFILSANSGAANYNGTPTLNTSGITDYLGSAIPMGTLWGTSSPLGAASGGIASGSYTYGEVGYFNLPQNAVSDSTYTAGSNNQANGDCVANSTSNTASSGLYGCTIGSAATSWGRFVPDHFALASGAALVNRADIAACSSSTFTYMGEDFKTTFTLVAQNGNNQTTTNYAGSYAKLGPLTTYATFGFAAASGTLAQGTTAAPSGSWSAGQAAMTAYQQLTRSSTTPSAPYTTNAITMTPIDSDGVTTPSALALGSTALYYGRLQVSSYSGALNTSLQLPVRAYYWSGIGSVWITQSLDSCTVIPASAVALSNYQSSTGASTASWTTSATGSTLSGGQGTITLAAPTLVSGSTIRPGSVSLALNLGSGTADVSCLSSHPATTGAALGYLRSQNGCLSTYSADPAVTATFGVYTPESTKTMYLRELY